MKGAGVELPRPPGRRPTRPPRPGPRPPGTSRPHGREADDGRQWRMPGLEGFEILRRLRGEVELSGIPVLILTATVDEERSIRRHGVEPHGFMRKPFEADALLAEVERLLK